MTSTPVATRAASHPAQSRIARSTPASKAMSGVLLVLGAALFAVPMLFTTNVVLQCTNLFIFMILAVMWNALAGYGGMVSVGQQAFIGFGAYATIWLTHQGISPFPSMILAAALSAVLAAVVALLVLQLKGGHLAVGTWVVAEALGLLVVLDKGLGGGTGVSLQGLNSYAPELRRAYIYWLTLAVLIVLLGALFLLLRLKTGSALQAIRDDEEAAASLGVRVRPLKFGIFVLAGFGCGAAGALILANTLFIQPQSIFGVQYSAYMIFMVLVGGLGTFEGPILGAIIFFVVQQQFADQGAWYLIGLGVIAVLFALFLPRGLWTVVSDRLPVQLPLGYHLYTAPQPVKERRS
ncbi:MULTISPECIES: branched-chain amino acid ABC transporter permease [Pseudofrankia]|uniref:branched-chain amino acid ABC transporter permease n=1 Tax=Pseudofrankia TaxID=2994363 RepID=UPI000234BC83|nr:MULTISPECIES: branched-chain amino acid ABC transporter permease [Pseudofrankia]OHV30065.1 ABC transporter permease [Pseudofrankia sp. EUN1h]